MDNITTLEKVSDRVNEMSQNCIDKNVTVADISFDNLETVRIGDTETHQLREIAQRSISYRLGIPFQYLRKCPPDIQALNMNHWIDTKRMINYSSDMTGRRFELYLLRNISLWIILRSWKDWILWDTVLKHGFNVNWIMSLCC